jgi:ATP-dependent RNA helicase RhlE
MKFEDYPISPEIRRSLEELAYKRPTDIQFRAIPSILKGEDVLAIAQTGTGKTAAFAIPVVSLLEKRKKDRRSGGISCIVLAPTHELAQQITEVFDRIGRYSRIKTLCIIGGVDQEPQIESLAAGPDILVATPGRMFDLISQGHIRTEKLSILVLDEADHMLDLGFIKDIRDLTRLIPRKRQTLFFSATLNPRIKKLAYSLVRNPIHIQVSPKDPVARNIHHSVAFIEMDDKRHFLERLVKENPESKIIAFVRTIVRAERVAAAMERAGISCQRIHREKPEAERAGIMRRFREGGIKLLVATDITARGIDIPDVDYVVNYDMPQQSRNYVHRVGRTGRAEKKGLAISFCSPAELPILREIESFLKQPIEVMEIHPEHYAAIVQPEKPAEWRELVREDVRENKGKKKRSRAAGKKKSPKGKKKK